MVRSAGDGSLYKDARGMWTASVTLPPGPDGTRRRKVVRSKNRAVATQKLRDLRAELDRSGDIITASATVATWMERWLDGEAAERLRPRTLATYTSYTHRWIVPAIGRVRLDQLTPQHVRRVQDLAAAGYGEGRTAVRAVSSTTRLQIHRILAVALRDAVRAGLLRDNPAGSDRMAAPRKRHYEARTLTAAQARDLLAHASQSDDPARWAVALLTGMRQGEQLGLERSAVDLDAGVITVRWQSQKLAAEPPEHVPHRPLGGGYWLVPPKTRAGLRVVPVTPLLHAALAAHMDSMRPATAEHDLLFRRDGDLPRSASGDLAAWKRLLAGAGLPEVRLHDARHGVATLLLEAGVDMRVIQEILGHSSMVTTHGYAHVNLELARAGMEKIDKLLTP